ncbi:class I adenylate-forming enzyme family protein [Oceanicoccus sagamiensis]|uniref:Long-chain fatty acid--CoA ligase n=1 Tax=Oceanicoccus sagamiensis TaxID=716816 RepID=A0A1X9NB43_9GAMM|nr:class I adenylate-forming enzyme family protein [Oceanicoccus sagamiensis]ARN75270.1 long-chain fatty acid--CoA ligase [Oceanicoccus sagamiensis]
MTLKNTLDNIQQAIAGLTAPGGDFEIIQADVLGQSLPVYKPAPGSLRDIYMACLQHNQKTFLVYHQQRLSFMDTYQQTAKFAYILTQQFDVKKGDRVAIAMRNNPEWIVAFMAATSLGAVAVPMNGWWTTEELEYGLQDCGAKVVVVDNQRMQRIEPFYQAMDIRAVVISSAANSQPSTDTQFNYSELMSACADQQMPTVEISTDDDATILYTSGSSGKPKGVVATHRSIINTLVSWLLLAVGSEVAGAKPDNMPEADDLVALLTVPLFHVTGCHSLFLLSLIIGRKVVMMHKWDPQEALKLIEQEKVTYVNGVPTMSQELLDAAENTDRDISSLVELASGGAARPPEHVRRISETFKMNPVNGYGLTETNAMGAVNAGITYIECPDSVGMPSPAVTEIRIVDEQGNSLPAGERGEICIKSPANARGYWNNPTATADAFKDGWFHTGDVGYLDDLNMLFIVDRIKDIIIRGGENISCNEVEAAIYAYEGVAEVAVFAVPDERLGEVVGAKLFMKANASITEQQLVEFLQDHIAAYKIPSHLIISEEPLPRTATDKIFKREIKEQYLAAMQASV